MGGKRIDDHAFWAGGKPKGSVLPMGAKMKEVSGEEGFGGLSYYEDTEEAIRKQQAMNAEKVHSHGRKDSNRN